MRRNISMPLYLWESIEQASEASRMSVSQFVRISCLRSIVSRPGASTAELLEHARRVGIEPDLQKVGACARCGEFFGDRKGRRKYCSDACKAAAYRVRKAAEVAQ